METHSFLYNQLTSVTESGKVPKPGSEKNIGTRDRKIRIREGDRI